MNLGVAQPTATNGFGSVAKNGPSVGLQYIYYWTDWIAWGADIDFAKFGKGSGMLDTTALLGTPSSTAFSVQSQAVAFNVVGRVNLRTDGASWTPYLLGGAGYGEVSDKWSAPNLPANAALPKSGGKTTGFDVLGAAGLEGFIAAGISLAFEARYTEYRHTGQTVSNVAVIPASLESLTYFLAFHLWFAPK